MFNFLVSGNPDAWNGFGYVYPRSRFLEYTDADVADSFRELESRQIDALLELPCMFAYEGTDEPVRIGRIKTIKHRNRNQDLYIEFEFDPNIDPIPYESILPLQGALDIRDWEMNRTHWAIKDEDLFDVLSRAGVPGINVGSKKIDRSNLPEPAPPQNHADNVASFVETVLRLSVGASEVFYRGHSKRKGYLLEPSLLRKDEKGNVIYLNNEDVMYRELLVSNSGDFREDVYTLDRLVRAQHYSLPTRLLDITSNPLISLYFACISNAQQDGEVIMFFIPPDKVKYFDSDTASCIANLARLSQEDKSNIDYSRMDDIEGFNKQQAVKRLLHFIKEEKPYFEGRILPADMRSVICVKGKHSNNRISFQSGAFLLFGHDAALPEEGSEDMKILRIGISNKVEILAQLDRLNINERTIYPNIDNSAKYIAKRFALKPNQTLS